MEQKKHSRQIRRWWGHQRIRHQIFLSLLLVSVLGISVLGSFSYQISRRTVEENYRKSHQASLKNTGKVLDMNLSSIIEMIRAFLNDPDLQQVLCSQTEDGKQAFTLTEQKIIREVAERLTTQESFVNHVAFMDLYGHYYLLSNVNRGTYDFYQYYAEHDFLEDAWSKEAREAGGREVFFREAVLGGVKEDGFSIAKFLNNPATGRPMGYVVVNISRGILAKSFVTGNEGYETNEYIVMDCRDGCSLVYGGPDLENAEEVARAFQQKEQQGRYLFSSVCNATTGWELVNVIERNELSAESKLIRNTVFLCAGLMAGLGFFLARLISRSITRPLNQLEQVIGRVGEGERHITEIFDDSEVGRIGSKFKEMVNTNLELSEYLLTARLNEREAELLLLQSQINPHFLYNTLDSLYCVAIIHGDDQIAEMILALSNNFKLSLNRGEKFSTVADAVMRIEEYMKLQNMRFNDRFSLEIEVEEPILQRKMLTFLLQPFVENAIYHGLEPKVGNGSIRVRGWQQGTEMRFTIEDDGVGMDDLTVLENGYGIRNIRERIHLHYGEQYGFSAESSRGRGTRITVVLPLEESTHRTGGGKSVPVGSD